MVSLLSDYDTVTGLSNLLNDGSCEPEFLRFVSSAADLKDKLMHTEKECKRLMSEIQKSNEVRSILERKLFTGMQMVEMEKKRRKSVEAKVNELEEAVSEMQCVITDNRNKLHEEVKEVLNSVYSKPNKSNSDIKSVTNCSLTNPGSNYSRSQNDVTSSGEINASSSLSDLGYSQSDDDLESSNSLRLTRDRQLGFKLLQSNAPTLARSTCTPFHGHRTCVRKRTMSPTKENKSLETTANAMSAVVRDGLMYPTRHISNRGPQIISKRSESPTESVNDLHSSVSLEELKINKNRIEQLMKRIPGTHPKSFTYTKKMCTKVHLFGQRTILRTQSCNTCGKRLKFGKLAAKCSDCKATVHTECKDKLALPCIPCPLISSDKIHQCCTISDYAPHDPPMVPSLIVHCVQELEARSAIHGFRALYQIPGEPRDVKMLKERFLRSNDAAMFRNIGTNVICGVIEEFLSSLNEPLIIPSLWSEFVTCLKVADENKEINLEKVLRKLPRPNRDTLAFLMLHLQRVIEQPNGNLSVVNLVKIFGPTLVGFHGCNKQITEKMKQRDTQARLLESMIDIHSQFWEYQMNLPFKDN